METADQPTFPPPGWVTNHEAARMLGVALDSLTCNAWRWRRALHAGARCVRHPHRGRCNIYSLEQIQRIIEDRAAAAKPKIPEGFVAALAYDDAARLWFGADARLNFADGVEARLAGEAGSNDTDSRAAA